MDFDVGGVCYDLAISLVQSLVLAPVGCLPCVFELAAASGSGFPSFSRRWFVASSMVAAVVLYVVGVG